MPQFKWHSFWRSQFRVLIFRESPFLPPKLLPSSPLLLLTVPIFFLPYWVYRLIFLRDVDMTVPLLYRSVDSFLFFFRRVPVRFVPFSFRQCYAALYTILLLFVEITPPLLSSAECQELDLSPSPRQVTLPSVSVQDLLLFSLASFQYSLLRCLIVFFSPCSIPLHQTLWHFRTSLVFLLSQSLCSGLFSFNSAHSTALPPFLSVLPSRTS